MMQPPNYRFPSKTPQVYYNLVQIPSGVLQEFFSSIGPSPPFFKMSSLVSVAKLALCVLVLTLPVNSEAIATDKIISRDVVIVGGGASGSHAAVSLRDLGKSVVVVEKKSTLVSPEKL